MPSEVTGRSFVNLFDSKEKMEQVSGSSPHVSSMSSTFSRETHFPLERQIGFWKHDASDQHATVAGSYVASSPIESFGLIGAPSFGCLESMQPYPSEEQNVRSVFERNATGSERTSLSETTSWRTIDQDVDIGTKFSVNRSLFMEVSKTDISKSQYENGLFCSSLSEIFNNKLRISACNNIFGHSIDTTTTHFEDDEPFKSLEEIEAQTIGNLLPEDDDDLFSGVIDFSDLIAQNKNGDYMEDFDLFSSVGGMELEADNSLSHYGSSNRSPDLVGITSNSQLVGSNGCFGGEHPFGEPPSRTLFIRNIDCNVEDTELWNLFEQYGDIRTLYTACKHRGFVMISYYDIRSACSAMSALQNKPLRCRKLDIHFSIPKENPSEKDINQGTLVVFNLDCSISNDELHQIFDAYGEIKEIREAPHKRHHRFIEFYDVRAAEAALRDLNVSDIAGKRIKLEPSRPGGARRCLTRQLSQDLEIEETNLLQQQGSPSNNPHPSCYGSHSNWPIPASHHHGGSRPTINQFIDSALKELSSSSIAPGISPPVRVASIGNNDSQSNLGEPKQSLGHMNYGYQGIPSFHPHSVPECTIMNNSFTCKWPGTMPAMTGIDGRHVHRAVPNEFQSRSFEQSEGNGSCPVHGHNIMWSKPNSYQPHVPSHMMWANSPPFASGLPGCHPLQIHGTPRLQAHMVNPIFPSPHHNVGSAPTVNPSLWDIRQSFLRDPGEPTTLVPGSFGSMRYSGNPRLHPLEFTSPNMFSHVGRNVFDPSVLANVGLPSPQQRGIMLPSRNPVIPVPPPFGSPTERMRGRGSDLSAQIDNKKQFDLDIDRIVHGEDTRTTLMIKNIPNKYTSKMLLAAIDECHRGTYDFIYLPIDFKNKCNVGYAFINMVDAIMHIIPFYESFNGKKWEKFNSEKVASLAYARIQGKTALIAHFQNSSLMNEDKRCRPILFHSDGPNAGDLEPFPMGVNICPRPGKPRTSGSEDNQRSPTTSPTREELSTSANPHDGLTKVENG